MSCLVFFLKHLPGLSVEGIYVSFHALADYTWDPAACQKNKHQTIRDLHSCQEIAFLRPFLLKNWAYSPVHSWKLHTDCNVSNKPERENNQDNRMYPQDSKQRMEVVLVLTNVSCKKIVFMVGRGISDWAFSSRYSCAS